MTNEVFWDKYIESMSLWRHRVFCVVYIIAYPLLVFTSNYIDTANFKTVLGLRLLCSAILSILLLFHFLNKIDGRKVSFATNLIIIVFHSLFFAINQQSSYAILNIEITVSTIFVILTIRWPVSYAITSMVLVLVLYPIGLYYNSPTALQQFFNDGGIFHIIANLLFPFVVRLRNKAEYQEFCIQNGLVLENKKLEKKYAEALEAANNKAEFLSIMSHEIRTALNGVTGIVYLLKDKISDNKEKQELVHTLQFSASQLMVIVNDVLDYGKLNTNHIELNITAFDLKLLLENLRKTLIPKVNLAKVELNFVVDEAIPSKLMGDPIRLGQILTNLINNAIRFTHHGEIRLTVKTTESTELKTKLHFEVSDTGEGIPEEDKEKIFEVYHQSASSSDLGMGGTGLGLAITRKLLDLFGSKIDFTSELGVGTTFFYEIEFDLIQNEMETPKPKAFKNDTVFENRKLLVVEDNKVNTMIIKILLNQKGIEFDLAVNGVEAIKLFENNQYDLIMMDLQMPIMNGYTATNKIREVDARIPIIAMSASAFQEAQEYALQNGFNDYIVKPFLPDDLYEIIEKNFIPLSKNVT